MPFEAHAGLSFHVQDLRRDLDAGVTAARAPVVMLHGLLVGSLATWYFTAAPKIARTRDVRLFDLRGHGKSERATEGYDLATMAGDLDALATAFAGDGPVALVGHSYGAAIALTFALRNPGRVSELVLVEAPLPASRAAEFDGFVARSPGAMLEALPEPLKEALARGGRQATRFVDGLRFLAEESSLFADLRAAVDVPDDALRALVCKVLCVYGDTSRVRQVGERLARVIPGARLAILPGGHFLPTESPAELTRCITEFLDG